MLLRRGGDDMKALDFFQFREKEACREGGMREGREVERGLLRNRVELEVIVITGEL